VISRGIKFADLPKGARIGTSALRRQHSSSRYAGHGDGHHPRNVETRIRKLEEEKLDAVILAAAGLKRLGYTDKVAEYLDTDLSIPAIGQGASVSNAGSTTRRSRRPSPSSTTRTPAMQCGRSAPSSGAAKGDARFHRRPWSRRRW